ncbi:MAG TPA: TOBE domain-containing protein, partial [Alphaproteobacteria bacterium]|nr:TOBE domain-containing protein [Alphaproteobacteria bacterium]
FVAAFFGQVNELHGEVRNGAVATPLGTLDAPGLADGTAVDVLIRPEALRLGLAAGDAVTARVMASRLLGRSSWIHLSLIGPETAKHGPSEGQAGHLHFHARVPGRFLPAEGEVLSVGLERSQAFVFPAASPS